MPQLIMSIDEIARRKQRDVIYIEFQDSSSGVRLDYKENRTRQIALKWFTEYQIPFYECGGYASDIGLDSYRGQVHIDVPLTPDNPLLIKVINLLGRASKVTALPGPRICFVSLLYAMENAHHDDPEYCLY